MKLRGHISVCQHQSSLDWITLGYLNKTKQGKCIVRATTYWRILIKSKTWNINIMQASYIVCTLNIIIVTLSTITWGELKVKFLGIHLNDDMALNTRSWWAIIKLHWLFNSFIYIKIWITQSCWWNQVQIYMQYYFKQMVFRLTRFLLHVTFLEHHPDKFEVDTGWANCSNWQQINKPVPYWPLCVENQVLIQYKDAVLPV